MDGMIELIIYAAGFICGWMLCELIKRDFEE